MGGYTYLMWNLEETKQKYHTGTVGFISGTIMIKGCVTTGQI